LIFRFQTNPLHPYQRKIYKKNLNENTYIPRSDKDINRLYDYLSTNEEYAFQVKSCVHKENGGYNAALITVYVDLVTEGRETEDY